MGQSGVGSESGFKLHDHTSVDEGGALGFNVVGAAQIQAAAVSIAKLNIGHPIFMFHGRIADLPAGYYFCDGTNGTPDLRDVCVVGARQDDGGVAKTNVSGALTQAGGEASHILSVDELPAHHHTEHTVGGGSALSGPGGYGNANTDTGNTGGGLAHNNLQPYYALAFAMVA